MPQLKTSQILVLLVLLVVLVLVGAWHRRAEDLLKIGFVGFFGSGGGLALEG